MPRSWTRTESLPYPSPHPIISLSATLQILSLALRSIHKAHSFSFSFSFWCEISRSQLLFLNWINYTLIKISAFQFTLRYFIPHCYSKTLIFLRIKLRIRVPSIRFFILFFLRFLGNQTEHYWISCFLVY
jgi:hypothetical protein